MRLSASRTAVRALPKREPTMAAEIIGEVKNLFNTEQVSSVNASVPTNAQGIPTGTLPTSGKDLTPTGGYEQRQFQLGFKFTF